MTHCDHFAYDGDVLSRIEWHPHFRQLDLEDLDALRVEPRAIHHRVGVPVLELHDDLDALLLPHGANAEDRRDVHEADAADLHVVPLQLVSAADEHVGAATRDEHEIVRDETVAALDQVEHALGLADSAAPREQQPDAEDVRE